MSCRIACHAKENFTYTSAAMCIFTRGKFYISVLYWQIFPKISAGGKGRVLTEVGPRVVEARRERSTSRQVSLLSER